MKKLLLILVLFNTNFDYRVMAQDPCDPDIEAPTFELPMYLTDGITYDCLDSVPLLTGPPYPDVMDLVFATLEDNCLSPDVPPWYGPTLSAGVLDMTDTSITYTFTGYDDGPNYNTQQITFYFLESCGEDSVNTGIHPRYADASIMVYPNPSNGEFTVTSKKDYQVLSMTGQVMDKHNLESGVYLVRVGGLILQTKLVIRR